MAGWTGLEPEAETFSNLVMARDFWHKRLNYRWLRRFVSFTAVHANLRGFHPRRGDILETLVRSLQKPWPIQTFSFSLSLFLSVFLVTGVVR